MLTFALLQSVSSMLALCDDKQQLCLMLPRSLCVLSVLVGLSGTA
jgi:hypothetical protein